MNIGSCKHGTNIIIACHLCYEDKIRAYNDHQKTLNAEIENLTNNLASNITKREHFAGLAMQGMLANSELMKELTSISNPNNNELFERIKLMAYVQADLMTEDI